MLIVLDNEMLYLILTTSRIKSFIVFGLIWIKFRNIGKKLDKVQMDIVNRPWQSELSSNILFVYDQA